MRERETMNSIFWVDDLIDPIWQPTTNSDTTPSSMNRIPSEWDLDRFLQEEHQDFLPPSLTSSNNLPPRHDSDEDHRAHLKSKLELACAAAAAKALGSSSSSVNPEDRSCSSSSSLIVEEQRGLVAAGSGSAQLVGPLVALGASQIKLGMQHEADGGLPGVPALPASVQRKQEVQVRHTASGSSGEDSDDDELEGDTGTNENMGPADVKRARRMQSNRESARRSRRRKQEQLNELESQVGQLRDERTSLLSRFTDINQKCDEAAVDNRILRADIETLRAKVQMAEEQVKQVTGNPMLLARSNITTMGSPFVGGQVDKPSKYAVPMPPHANQFFHQPIPSVNSASSHPQPLKNSLSNVAIVPHTPNGQTDHGNAAQKLTSMQLPAGRQNLVGTPSLHFVQNHIGPAMHLSGALPAHDWGVPKSGAKDNQ